MRLRGQQAPSLFRTLRSRLPRWGDSHRVPFARGFISASDAVVLRDRVFRGLCATGRVVCEGEWYQFLVPTLLVGHHSTPYPKKVSPRRDSDEGR